MCMSCFNLLRNLRAHADYQKEREHGGAIIVSSQFLEWTKNTKLGLQFKRLIWKDILSFSFLFNSYNSIWIYNVYSKMIALFISLKHQLIFSESEIRTQIPWFEIMSWAFIFFNLLVNAKCSTNATGLQNQ